MEKEAKMKIIVEGHYLGLTLDGEAYLFLTEDNKAARAYLSEARDRLEQIALGTYTRVSDYGDYIKVEIDKSRIRKVKCAPPKKRSKAFAIREDALAVPSTPTKCARCKKEYALSGYKASTDDGLHIFCNPCARIMKNKMAKIKEKADKAAYMPLYEVYTSLDETDEEYIEREFIKVKR